MEVLIVKPHAQNQSNNNDLDNNAFTCDPEYTLDKLLYFPKHKTLTHYCILINCKEPCSSTSWHFLVFPMRDTGFKSPHSQLSMYVKYTILIKKE